MEKKLYDNYIEILKSELIPALGCTEPIAVAYAAAKAREVLGHMPEHIYIDCSGNIIKNVKGVTVPNSGGLKGIDVAAILGTVGGKADKELEALQEITDADRQKTKELAKQQFCSCGIAQGKENLYILARAQYKNEYAVVEIASFHTNIIKIEKNGEILFQKQQEEKKEDKVIDKSKLNVKDILEFANCVKMEDIKDIIGRQVEMNSAIAQEGIKEAYGAQVGRTLLKYNPTDNIKIKAKAMAASGSDARMSGCPLPVVINSGSGNQGITASMPVYEYAKALQCSEEKMFRALVISNLISLHQKRYIGNLSAYCGATSAACGAACGIAYLYDSSYEVICNTITNAICAIGGMVCDGAKPSCAAKIAAAVEAGILGFEMSCDGNVYSSGEGLVGQDIEKTISNVGRMGKEGMKSTDLEILNIMLEK